ncbi:uncharacterized protein [Palaemon carinicauda]|uniref:uncharacterized protein n=1 Tax=Palaemon carinicauda TaxID=392227 RepID=UPI0035B684D1
MDSHFTTFKIFINVSTPDEEDTYSTPTNADVNAIGHKRLSSDMPELELLRTRRSLSKSADVRLVAANGCAIPTYSYKNLILSFGNGTFNLNFLIADVTLLILGADFLSHIHLLVDVAHRRLVNADSYLSTPLQPGPFNLAVHISAPMDAYAHHLTSYSEVFRPEHCQTPTAPDKHSNYHHIKTTGPPVFAKFRQPDHYSQPNIADMTSYLHKTKVFSTLDLLKKYYQVPMNPKEIHKTAFDTYTFSYSCFGLSNAGATFQHLMDGILEDLPFCVCYMNDKLVFLSSIEEQLRHLCIVLDCLQQNGLVVQYDKCTFGVNEVSFLGY